MSMMIFAHNGIEHSDATESAAHGSNTLIWIISGAAIVAVLLYLTIRFLGKSQTQETREEDE